MSGTALLTPPLAPLKADASEFLSLRPTLFPLLRPTIT